MRFIKTMMRELRPFFCRKFNKQRALPEPKGQVQCFDYQNDAYFFMHHPDRSIVANSKIAINADKYRCTMKCTFVLQFFALISL